MPTANIRTGSSHIATLLYAAAGAVAVGDIALVNLQVLIAMSAGLAGEAIAYAYQARKVEFPKTAALAINAGDVVYWDNAASEVNKTAAGNTKCGMCVEDAAAADAVVVIDLRANI